MDEIEYIGTIVGPAYPQQDMLTGVKWISLINQNRLGKCNYQ